MTPPPAASRTRSPPPRPRSPRGYAIECDVQDTADGEAVVFHDFTLDRLTAEKGLVRERTAAELARLAIGGAADRIPTLGRPSSAASPGATPLIDRDQEPLRQRPRADAPHARVFSGYAGPVALKSFDPFVVAAMRTVGAAAPARHRRRERL